MFVYTLSFLFVTVLPTTCTFFLPLSSVQIIHTRDTHFFLSLMRFPSPQLLLSNTLYSRHTLPFFHRFIHTSPHHFFRSTIPPLDRRLLLCTPFSTSSLCRHLFSSEMPTGKAAAKKISHRSCAP